MPARRFLALPLLIVTTLFLSACAGGGSIGLGAAEKTKKLREGMSYPEVVALLGEPASTQLEGGKLKARWSLHEYWKGWVPYDLEFNAKTKKLTAWKVNEAEYQRSQQQLAAQLGVAPSTDPAPATAPGQPGAAAAGDASHWTNYLAGRKLVRIYTGSGYREMENLRLCRNGVYHKSNESGGFGGGVSMASQGRNSGRWQASGPSSAGVLTLQGNGGGRTTYKVTLGNDGVYLNGTRYLRDGDAGC
jgi:hypothetical protein